MPQILTSAPCLCPSCGQTGAQLVHSTIGSYQFLENRYEFVHEACSLEAPLVDYLKVYLATRLKNNLFGGVALEVDGFQKKIVSVVVNINIDASWDLIKSTVAEIKQYLPTGLPVQVRLNSMRQTSNCPICGSTDFVSTQNLMFCQDHYSTWVESIFKASLLENGYAFSSISSNKSTVLIISENQIQPRKFMKLISYQKRVSVQIAGITIRKTEDKATVVIRTSTLDNEAFDRLVSVINNRFENQFKIIIAQ